MKPKDSSRLRRLLDSAVLDRRTLLRLGALAGAGASISARPTAPDAAGDDLEKVRRDPLAEASIVELQAMMAAGQLTSLRLVNTYLQRIGILDHSRARLQSILEINPEAREIARALDRERRQQGPRGPLHGIPVVLKANIDTGDEMQTTAGSLALVGDPAHEDATVAERLRAAGAVILGKANLSEWANFRGFSSSSGWSGLGGQTRNPYVLDRNPCGSSSGSAAAVSAGLCAASLGTETDGSIVCPSGACGVVGIKPTLGLTSRAGVIPIAHSQDVVGPHGRTVADAAAILGALTGVDPRDPATAASAGNFHTDYTQFLDPDGLAGARIGVHRGGGFTGYSAETDAVFEEALAAMAAAGATLVDPADLPTIDELLADPAELIVLVYEFKRDLNAYLSERWGVPVRTMADVIEFNLEHADDELQWFGQEWFELSQDEIFSQAEYDAALPRGRALAGVDGIDAVMDAMNLDALVAPTGSPAWTTDLINGDHFLGASSTPAAVAGYPSISVPAGSSFGLPVGISFFGRAWSEPTLIRIASGFEATVAARTRPGFLTTLPLDRPFPRRAGRRAGKSGLVAPGRRVRLV
ncbi:MAG TPA: amidase [Thermoanaerobaculia bacterium]|nr:amidase [Thermoanaerobaculia bacterium]